MESIRQQLVKRFPPRPRIVEPDDQLGYALECMLWSLPDPDVSVDGWRLFKVVRESEESLDAVGLMWVLPSGGCVPIALHLNATDRGISWKAQVSVQDAAWQSMSDSKQWNNVYLFANGDRVEPPWAWNREYEGTL